MYRNDQPVRMPLGIAKIYYDMPQRIAHPLKQHLIDHFNRKRYYEYHSGYRPVPPDHEQYIRQAILRYGWTEPVEFNAYVDDLQGRRVAQPAKGLYIVNGKKVVIK